MKDAAALVREYVESVWNRWDIAAFRRMTTPDFRYHLGDGPARDRSGMGEFLEATRRAFPDWRVEVHTLVAQEDHVAVRWSGTVTHEGEFHGIPPTRRRITVSGINLYRIAEDQVAEEWEQMDSLGMLRQLDMGS